MNNETVKPKAFQCYLDNITVLEHLSDEEAGQLWKLLFNLAVNDVRGVSDNPMVSMAFDMMANKLERDFAAYRKRVEASRENGKKGGAPIGNQNAAKHPKPEWEQKTTQTTQTSQYKDKYKDKDKYEDKYKDEYEDKDEDKYPSALADSAAVAAASDVVSLFDRICVGIPRTSDAESLQRRIIQAESALKGNSFDDYFRRVANSDFLTGRSGKWRGCTLEWLLKPDTIAKVLGGFYDERGAQAPPPEYRQSYNISELEEIDTLDGW